MAGRVHPLQHCQGHPRRLHRQPTPCTYSPSLPRRFSAYPSCSSANRLASNPHGQEFPYTLHRALSLRQKLLRPPPRKTDSAFSSSFSDSISWHAFKLFLISSCPPCEHRTNLIRMARCQ